MFFSYGTEGQYAIIQKKSFSKFFPRANGLLTLTLGHFDYVKSWQTIQ